jgi:hypothetical protein
MEHSQWFFGGRYFQTIEMMSSLQKTARGDETYYYYCYHKFVETRVPDNLGHCLVPKHTTVKHCWVVQVGLYQMMMMIWKEPLAGSSISLGLLPVGRLDTTVALRGSRGMPS